MKWYRIGYWDGDQRFTDVQAHSAEDAVCCVRVKLSLCKPTPYVNAIECIEGVQTQTPATPDGR